VHFLSPDQQSEIHCLIICAIQLLTPNNLAGREDVCETFTLLLLTALQM